MPLPLSFGTITLTGKYVDFLGQPAAGTVQFTPPANVFLKATDVDVMIVPKTVTVTLDVDGAFSITLPVTDDPDVVPAFTYAVAENVGGVRRSFNVEIPHTLTSPVDLSDLAPTGSVTVGTTALTKTVADSLYAPIDGGGLTTVASTDITDSTATGRSLLTAADAPTARTAIGAGTSSLTLGTTAGTAKAGDYQPTAANISDATLVGRNVLKAVDAPAARTAIGAGTASTKADVGLGNVDNTSDLAKPVSTATQAALNAKAPLASPTFTGTVSGVTKAMVGLGSVDNTADTAKPVSTAQQAALDLKQNTADAFSGQASDLTGLFASTITAMTSNTGRVGLAVLVGFNDAGAAWPTVPAALLSDANVGVIWAGGDDTHQPPSNSGPSLWIEPVV
jgi:hypothetical protein